MASKLNLDFTKHPERVAHYRLYENDIKLGNIECLVPLQKVPIIGQLNDLRINVFGNEKDKVCPMYTPLKKILILLIYCWLAVVKSSIIV